MAATNKVKLLEILPAQTKLFVMYGATEAAARLAYVEPAMLKEKIDSIGKPIPGVALKVIDVQGNELPIGDEGELVATGDNIMQGYWHNKLATDKALSKHGYHTGDYAYQDEDGYFFVVGRKDNQLKVGGHRINIQEVEDVILTSDLAVETVVIGIPDPLLENKLVAIVTAAESGLDVNQISAYCDKKLPAYKMPHTIFLVDSLPKGASGKIDRKRCEQLIVEY